MNARTIHKFTAPITRREGGAYAYAEFTVPRTLSGSLAIVRAASLARAPDLTVWIETMHDHPDTNEKPMTVTVTLHPTGAPIPLGTYITTLQHPDGTTIWHAYHQSTH